MDKTLVGLLVLFACTGAATCYEYCQTSYLVQEYCTYECCDSSYGYDYCCYDDYTDDIPYWVIGPVIGGIIFIAAVVTMFVCCCVTASNGMTRYQSWSTRQVGATSIAMTSSVNQQQSIMPTMTNMYYPQQAYPMGQQPYGVPYQQPYTSGPQFNGPQQGGSQPPVPPPYSYIQNPNDPPKF